MPHHRPAERIDKATKCMLWVARSRAKNRICREKKVMLVARRRVGVGPGVKMEVQRDSRNVAMSVVEGLRTSKGEVLSVRRL